MSIFKARIQRIWNFLSRHRTFSGFLAIGVMVLIVTVLGIWFCAHSFSRSQHAIVENHRRQTAIVDSMLMEMRRDISSDDPIRRWKPGYVVDRAILYKNLDQTNQDIQTMLEMQMPRIQTEYETLSLWAGIVTVVFLIFSFYSLFKTDQLSHQASANMDAIRDMKIQASEDVIKLKERGNKIIERSQRHWDRAIEKHEAKMTKSIDKMSADFDKFIKESDTTVREWKTSQEQVISARIDEVKKETETKTEATIAGINKSREGFESLIENFETEFDAIRKQIESLKNQAADALSRLNQKLSHEEETGDPAVAETDEVEEVAATDTEGNNPANRPD